MSVAPRKRQLATKVRRVVKGHEATYAVQQIAAYSITSSAVASSVCGMLRPSTLDAVAERAGISKGGLVYSFATKDGLVRAALEREVTRFQGAVRQRLGGRPVEPFELVLAHIDEALDEDDGATRKAAFLVTALVHAPDMMEPARRYYRALLDPLLSDSGAAHGVRHALLAVEGIFLLRGLGFVEVSAEEHKSVLLHARDIVAGVLAGR